MTKREFFENELNMTPSEVGSAVPMNVDGEKEVTEGWLIDFIKHLIEDRKKARKTLRDQFAMSALMCFGADVFTAPEYIAEKAYRVADAMIEVRSVIFPHKHGKLIDSYELACKVAEVQDKLRGKDGTAVMLLGDILRWIESAEVVVGAKNG